MIPAGHCQYTGVELAMLTPEEREELMAVLCFVRIGRHGPMPEEGGAGSPNPPQETPAPPPTRTA